MNTQEIFETFKKEFTAWCKANGACVGEFQKVLASTTAAEILAVIHANFHWCMDNQFDVATLKVFGDDVLFSAKIIVCDATGNRLDQGVWCVSQSTVTAYDSSTVKAYGSSTVEAYDSSTVTACDSSTVKAYGSSTVTAWDWAIIHVRKNLGHRLELGQKWNL